MSILKIYCHKVLYLLINFNIVKLMTLCFKYFQSNNRTVETLALRWQNIFYNVSRTLPKISFSMLREHWQSVNFLILRQYFGPILNNVITNIGKLSNQFLSVN